MYWPIILLAYLNLFIFGLIDNSRGAVYPQILDHFRVSYFYGSQIFAMSSFVAFIMTLISKRWLEPLNLIKSSRLALLLMAIGSFMFWASAKFQFAFIFMIFASMTFGLGVGITSMTPNMIITTYVDSYKQRRLLSGLHAMYGLAAFSAPVLVALLFKLELKWFDLYLITGFICLVLAAIFNISDQKPVEIQSKKTSFKKYICYIAPFYVCSEIIVSSRLVVYLKENAALSDVDSQFYLSLFFALLLSGRILFSLIHINLKPKLLMQLSTCTTLILLFLGMIWNAKILAFSGLSMSFFFPAMLEYAGKHYQGSSQAVIAMMMRFVGAGLVLMHWFFGIISSLIGVSYAMSLGLVMTLLCLYFLQKLEN